MPPIPSLPFLSTASFPEVLWVLGGMFGTLMAFKAWRQPAPRHIRLKHGLRAWTCALFTAVGIVAALTPPSATQGWLSVITPMTMAVGSFSMAMLSVIDEQAKG